jgi:hypothetical protein
VPHAPNAPTAPSLPSSCPPGDASARSASASSPMRPRARAAALLGASSRDSSMLSILLAPWVSSRCLWGRGGRWARMGGDGGGGYDRMPAVEADSFTQPTWSLLSVMARQGALQLNA